MIKNLKNSAPRILQFPQSGELLRNVMDHAAVGMALVSAEERVLYANPALCDMLGYEPDDLSELRLDDITPADALSGASIEFQRLRAGKTDSFRAECEYRRKDGSLTWVLLSASVLRDEKTSDSLHLILQINDIDKQKRAEAALTYTENRWNNALEAAGQGVWDHDIRSDKMFYSRMWRIMRGYAPDEEIDDAQETWLSRIHPDDRERILQVVEKQDRGEDGYDTLEYRERHKDGHYVWIYSRGRPIEWAPDGTAIRTVGTDTDITRQKEVESQLAEEKERLRVTLQSIGEGVISTDADGRITFMNEIAEQMTDWQAIDAVGQKIDDVFHSTLELDGMCTLAVGSVAQCLAQGEIFRLSDYSLMTSRSGETRYVRESAAPVRTESGELIGAVMVFQDTTARRKMQQDLTYAATHDSLTHLPNRMAFESRFEDVIETANKEQRTHALCLIDLDYFKQVNDDGGHAAGDTLLKEVAKRIKEACRRHDFAARTGGDEFAVILEDCDLKNAQNIAQSIVDSISRLQFVWHEKTFQIGASVGITAIAGQKNNPDALYRNADAACYDAKARGRNCVVVFEEENPPN